MKMKFIRVILLTISLLVLLDHPLKIAGTLLDELGNHVREKMREIGYKKSQINHLLEVAGKIPHDDANTLRFQLRHQGISSVMTGIYMDTANEISFFSRIAQEGGSPSSHDRVDQLPTRFSNLRINTNRLMSGASYPSGSSTARMRNMRDVHQSSSPLSQRDIVVPNWADKAAQYVGVTIDDILELKELRYLLRDPNYVNAQGPLLENRNLTWNELRLLNQFLINEKSSRNPLFRRAISRNRN